MPYEYTYRILYESNEINGVMCITNVTPLVKRCLYGIMVKYSLEWCSRMILRDAKGEATPI